MLVIGCGHWGRNYLRLLRTLGRGPIIACDVEPARRAEIARNHPDIDIVSDHRAALERDDVTAAIVATTARHHHAITLEALAAGKHVLVEKPLTLEIEHGLELIRASAASDRTLMVAHTFLYNPAVRAMREHVVAGEAGSIYYLQATRTHLGLVRPDVNAVWDLAPHDISIFGYLLGSQPISVSATGGRYLSEGREDVAFINLVYPGGIVANIFVSWVDSNKMRRVALVGSRARIVFDDLDVQERLKIYHKGLSIDRPYADFGEFQLLVRDGDIVSPRVDNTEPLRIMTEHFLDCCLTGARPLTGADEGLAVVRVLAAIDASLTAGGAPIALDALGPLS